MRARPALLATLLLSLCATVRSESDVAEDPYPSSDYLTGGWDGLRGRLADRGLYLDVVAIVEGSWNFSGGLDDGRGSAQYLVDVMLTLETEPLFGWRGGTFYLDYQDHGGENPSDELVGDWQYFSWLNARDMHQISELWFSQELAEGFATVKLGKIDANIDFAVADNAEDFLHSGMAYTIYTTFPTYPEPATGVEVLLEPLEGARVAFGLFDGAYQEGYRTGSRGPSTFLGDPSDLFLVGEGLYGWRLGTGDLEGDFRAGAWHHTGTFDEFDGGTQDGATGFYLALDQRLRREANGEEETEEGIYLSAFLEGADDNVLEVSWHASASLSWRGALPSRDEDSWGLGASYIRFTDDAGAGFTDDGELACEIFYRARVGRGIWVTGDLQYIASPGGIGLDDAVAGTLRLEFDF